MKDSAAAQHELDRAEFRAVRAQSRANFEEHRGRHTLAAAKKSADERRADRKARMDARLAEANARIIAANERINAARGTK